MDVIFSCPHCDQELAVEAEGAGSEIECPSCGEAIIIPESGEVAPAHEPNPIKTSAEAQIERHFKVPQRDEKAKALIKKSQQTLEAAARGTGETMIHTFRRSDCVEVGKDHFDATVNKFLAQIGEENLLSIHPVTYSHQDLASHQWITDYGVVVVYRDQHKNK